MLNTDLTQTEVSAPLSYYCSSGHIAPKEWTKEPGSKPEQMRFFHVKSKDIDGVYCECCLIVAHHLGQEQKKKLVKF